MSSNNHSKKPPDRGSSGGHNLRSFATQTTDHYPPNHGGPQAQAQARSRRCGCKTVVLLSVVVAFAAVIAGQIFSNVMMEKYLQEQMMQSLGEGISIFKAYDRDGDGYLNVIEFEPLLERLNIEETDEGGDIRYGDEDVDPAEEVLTIEAAFIPLQQDTMSKKNDMSFLSSKASLRTLDRWIEPYEKLTAFPVSAFSPFLPDKQGANVGEPYFVVQSKLGMFTNQLSSNRFYPPRVKGHEIIVQRLLSLFHPRPFVHTRFGPQGSVAVVRAMNAEFVDIVFRIHAEFQLNEPPNHPFWFTPGQFTGNLVIRKDASHIEEFHLYVPANKSLNVDMEWMNGPNEVEHMEVDIGFMPEMELTISGPSSQVTIYSENGEVLYEPSSQQDPGTGGRPMVWDEEISMDRAARLLEVKMYPFKKIEYFPLNEAFQRAQTERRLVHHVLLWGVLDDQSC